MIAGYLHQGSGLGNQLFRYVATRVLAEDGGYSWAMIYNPDGSGKEEGFKGRSFIDLKLPWSEEWDARRWNEKKVVENGVDIRSFDPEFNFIEDNTIIEGEFQDPRYFEHRLTDVNQWLSVEPLVMPDDLCVIGFRGGEYRAVPDLYLPWMYWEKSMKMMREINPNMRFEVHTDDLEQATFIFHGFADNIIHDIGFNWRAMRYARYAIIANSSFYILPRLLRHHDGGDKGDLVRGRVTTIAPRFWARYNTRQWALPQNFYRQFTYIHHAL